ncbi:hypothetical protein SFUMM280S_07555 [Streptomyces fumanus]
MRGGGPPDGLFVRDARHLSRWQLTVDGAVLEPLAPVASGDTARCVLVPRGGRDEPPAYTVFREQAVTDGVFIETLRVTGNRPTPATVRLAVTADADFADQFELRADHRTYAKPGAVRGRHVLPYAGLPLAAACARGLADLAALHIPATGPDGEDLRVPAGGAPWFLTLLGRDALLTSLFAGPTGSARPPTPSPRSPPPRPPRTPRPARRRSPSPARSCTRCGTANSPTSGRSPTGGTTARSTPPRSSWCCSAPTSNTPATRRPPGVWRPPRGRRSPGCWTTAG